MCVTSSKQPNCRSEQLELAQQEQSKIRAEIDLRWMIPPLFCQSQPQQGAQETNEML